ncbi:GDSL-type esterase/lipase family protein [Microbacterium testaceum]|uniref:GDSL-type esterase/lipase family protein n=1 Tax=Microbacterium testaceum TaxID=2033 RepID=UPI0034228A8F
MSALRHTTRFPSADAEVVGALGFAPGRYGVAPRRLPDWTRRQIPDPGFDFVVGMTSGVRVALTTRASVIELELAVIGIAPGAPALVELVVDGELRATVSIPADEQTLLAADGSPTQERPPTRVSFDVARTENRASSVELWLPHTAAVELVALRADASFAPSRDGRPIWLHHGSSISQCGEASAPTRTWPAIAAALGGVSLRSLGFSGNAVGDPFVARTIRDHPADAISIEIGINVVNGDLMRRRAFGPILHGVLDTIREGHPTTPLMVLGPIPCPSLESMPGPTVIDPTTGQAASAGNVRELDRGAMSLGTVRQVLHEVLSSRSDDPFLFALDGRELLPETEIGDLDDGLHPNAAAYERMGRRFADHAFAPGGPFSPSAAPRP